MRTAGAVDRHTLVVCADVCSDVCTDVSTDVCTDVCTDFTGSVDGHTLAGSAV